MAFRRVSFLSLFRASVPRVNVICKGSHRMPRFMYQALDAESRLQAGELEAPTLEAARHELSARGWKVEDVRTVASDPAAAKPSSSPREIRPGDAVAVAAELSRMVRAGAVLESGLRALVTELPSGRVRRVLSALEQELSRGVDLPTALERVGAPADLRALVQLSRRGEDLPQLLDRYVMQVQRSINLQRRVLFALGYPAVLACVGLLAFLFIVFVCKTQFDAIFASFGVRLPWSTQMIMNVSRVAESEPLMLVATIVGGLTALVGACLFASRWRWTWVILNRLPLVSGFFYWGEASRSLASLALLIESRAPLPETLKAVAETCRNGSLRGDFLTLASGARAGFRLSDVAMDCREFPAGFAAACEFEQSPPVFCDVLRSLAQLAAGRQANTVDLWITLIEPMLLIAIGAFLMFIVMSLFAPLLILLNDLS